MSEANILNASASDQLNPDYGYSEGLPEMRTIFQAQSGNIYQRRNVLRGRSFDLAWNRRPQANIDALRQWERQYENDFFTYVDWARTRYYSGRFESPLIYSQEGNDAWTARGRFVELPGKAMYQYPTANFGRDGIYIEERDGDGKDLLKLTGVWTYGTGGGFAHPGTAPHEYTYPNTDTAGRAEWIYFGYGCYVIGRQGNNLGKFNWRIVRVRDNADLTGARSVDQYDPGSVGAFGLDSYLSLPLDLYRISIESTNTKNAASAGKTITADAIAVFQ